MAKLTLTDILTAFQSTAQINANNALIEAAIENTLSRDGTSPNTMESDIDMDSNRILNLPAPSADSEPLRLSDIPAGSSTTSAALVSIADTAGRYTGANVEAALDEIITSVDNLTALRAITPSGDYRVYLQGYASEGDGGHGLFRAVTTGGTYTDNDGTIIVPGGGSGTEAWIREDTTQIVPEWFGLSLPLTVYVRTDGSDSNTGLANTAAGAFLTLQAAVDMVQNKINPQGTVVTIQVGDGTYTDGVRFDGGVQPGEILLKGNTTTPASCIISTTSENCVTATDGANVFLRGFKLTAATSGGGIITSTGALVQYEDIDFGAVVDAQVEVGTGATAIASGDYEITGGGTSHFHAGSEGSISTNTITITVTGTPTFSAYFVGIAMGSVDLRNVTFSTISATCKKFLVHKNGTLDIGSNNIGTFIPGSSAGTCNTGGIVATTDIDWTPVLTFATPGDLSVAYTSQTGKWSREGDLVTLTCEILTSTFTHTTASGNLLITGLPWISNATAEVYSTGAVSFQGINKASYTQVNSFVVNGSTNASFLASGMGQALANVTAADMPTGGAVRIRMTLTYRAAT